MTSQPPISAPPPYGPPPYGPPQPQWAVQAVPTDRRTSVFAVVSLVAGLTWWFWAGSIVAVVLGHLARKEVREQGLGGDTLAIFGLILGYIGVFTLVMFVGTMWLGTLSNAVPR